MSSESSTDDQERQRLLVALRESELIRELAELLASSLDLKRILQVLTKRTTEACAVERCSVWLRAGEQETLRPTMYHLSTQRVDLQNIHAADALWQQGHVLFHDAELLQRLEDQPVVLVDDLRDRPESQEIAETFLVRSVLLVALKREGRLLGIMSLDDPDSIRTFSPEQQQLARAIGQQAARAIDNARLYEQAQAERRRAERLIERAQAINQVAVAVNAGEALTKVMDMALHHLVRALGSDGGVMALLEKDALQVISHTRQQRSMGASHEITKLPACYQAAASGLPVFVKARDLMEPERQWFRTLGLGNCILVPLMGGKSSAGGEDAANVNQCSGLAFVNFRDPDYIPTRGQIAFAQDIAAQCALAIAKDRLLFDLHTAAHLANERANTLDAVFQAMTEGIVVMDENGDVHIRNRAASHFLGIAVNSHQSLEMFLQQFPTYTLHEQPLPPEDFPLSRALRGERIRGERFSTIRSDREKRVIEVNVTRVQDESQHASYVCAFHDITGQVSVEEGFQKALQAMLDIADAASGMTGVDDIMTSVLELTLSALDCERGVVQQYHLEEDIFTLQQASGFADEEAEARWRDEQRGWLTPDHSRYQGFREQIMGGHATVINAGHYPDQPNPYQHSMMLAIPIKHKDRLLGLMTIDRSTYGQTSVFSLPKEGAFLQEFTIWELAIAEAIAQIAGVAIAQANWQQEAIQSRSRVEAMGETNRMKDAFLAMAAHEFRSPLSIIQVHCQMALRAMQKNTEENVPPRISEHLTGIVGQTRLLTSIVHTFLDASNIREGKLVLKKEPVNLSDVAQQVMDDLAEIVQNQKLTYLPLPSDYPYLVMGDNERLQEILANLIQNALKYSPRKGTVTVTMRHVPAEGDPARRSIEVCVSDQGIGIPQDAQPHIFERFYRAANSADSQAAGIGLGLYIVAELLHLHDGSIRAESSGVQGEGSRFIFTLPAYIEAQQLVAPEAG